jgi:glyoxylase-like metal-dependent hydrolase (beta-lactamase superfamily II)
MLKLSPRLHFLRFPIGHCYLWHDADGLTLVDSGVPGSAPAIAEAISAIGYHPTHLRRLVLTHFHDDHIGSAAEIAGWGEVQVYAHRAEAPVIRGEQVGPAAVLADWEVELQRSIGFEAPTPEPCRVDHEVGDGDVLDFGGGAQAVAVPGHTPGSLAVYLPEWRVLFTGDTIARAPDGRVMLGVFNVDREEAAASLRKQAELDVDIACFGHGEPLTENTSAILRSVARRV